MGIDTKEMTAIERLVSENTKGTIPTVATLDSEEKVLAFAIRVEDATRDKLAADKKALDDSYIAARTRFVR